MAITDFNLGGKVFTDAGTPVNGATIAVLETGTSTEEVSTTTNSSGEWSVARTIAQSGAATYDVKISVGSSVRYILWSDEITLKGVDTASLKVRGVEGAAAPIYLFADQADDNIDVWRINAADGGVLTFDSRASGSSDSDLVAHITITPNATVASSTVAFAGSVTVATTLDVNGTADFDVTDYDIASSGDIDLVSTNDAAAAIYLHENGGTSGTIKIHADQGTSVTEAAESINILSDAGGVGIRSTANLAKAINITSDGGTTGSIAIFNDQGTSVAEGTESISLLSDAGGVGIRSTANLANAVNITVDGGTTSTMTLFNDQGTAATEGAASIQLLSDVGGINIKSGLNGANAILLTADGGTSETIVLHADRGTGTGSIELLSDAGGIELDAGTDIILDAGGADIFLKDDGTLFGTLNNSSGELVIKSSSSGTTAATFSGANVTFAGTVDATTDFTIGSTVITDDVITFTPSTSDTVTLTSSTNGAFSLVTVDNAAAAANIQITADGTAELAGTTVTLDSGGDIALDATDDINIPTDVGLTFGDDGEKIEGDGTNLVVESSGTLDLNSGGVLTLDSGAAINIEPAGGSAILLDGTISIDAGVVTGATSITSTAFVGTLSTAAQANVTSLGTLTALTGGTGDLNWDSGTLFVDSSADKIGIGTTSPDQQLHLFSGSAGTVDANSNTRLVIEDDATNGMQFLVPAGDQSYIMFGDVDDNDIGFIEYNHTGNTLTFRTNAENQMRINDDGLVFIGDDLNGNMTTGLTINQGAAIDEIFALKSSDVGHGVTESTETDTFFYINKVQGTGGGAKIVGLSDPDDSSAIAISIEAVCGVAANTTKTAGGGLGVLDLSSRIKSGSGAAAVGTDGNLISVRNSGVARFLFDAEGSGHADVEWTTYATHDDLALVAAVESELLLHEDDAKTQRRHMLEEVGIIGEDSWHMENGKPRAMVNMTKLSMLHHGALIQAAERIQTLESRLLAIEGGK
jgi:hypothetical protein